MGFSLPVSAPSMRKSRSRNDPSSSSGSALWTSVVRPSVGQMSQHNDAVARASERAIADCRRFDGEAGKIKWHFDVLGRPSVVPGLDSSNASTPLSLRKGQ